MNLEKPVAAICHGPWLLCSARCIKGRHLTSFIAIKDDVENAGFVFYTNDILLELYFRCLQQCHASYTVIFFLSGTVRVTALLRCTGTWWTLNFIQPCIITETFLDSFKNCVHAGALSYYVWPLVVGTWLLATSVVVGAQIPAKSGNYSFAFSPTHNALPIEAINVVPS